MVYPHCWSWEQERERTESPDPASTHTGGDWPPRLSGLAWTWRGQRVRIEVHGTDGTGGCPLQSVVRVQEYIPSTYSEYCANLRKTFLHKEWIFKTFHIANILINIFFQYICILYNLFYWGGGTIYSTVHVFHLSKCSCIYFFVVPVNFLWIQI